MAPRKVTNVKNEAAPEPEVEDVQHEVVDATESSQPDAVLVIKKVSEEGTISTEVMPLGNIQATEVQTLLELGVKGWRSQIGLA